MYDFNKMGGVTHFVGSQQYPLSKNFLFVFDSDGGLKRFTSLST